MSTLAPQVSVIIPAYNQARFLTGCLESVLAQTFQDFEIILVDDGSTDNTPEVAQKFGNRLVYIRQENQGLAGARNTGIRHARGKYIALLDSDDLWLPSFLQTMMALALANPQATVFYCGWQYMDSEGRLLPQPPHTRVVPPRDIYKFLLRVNFIIPSTVVMNRSNVLEAGLFDPSFRRLQDWELWIRLLKAGHVIVGSGVCLVHYRLHGDALSTDPLGGQRAALALVEKHFGPDDGLVETWTEDKRRAYGGVYRYRALYTVQRQNDWASCAKYLYKALYVDPTLGRDLDLYYELGLGSQPLGYRGLVEHLNLDSNAQNLSHVLRTASTLGFHKPEFRDTCAQAFGSSYLALGLLAYRIGHLTLSRHYLLKAVAVYPALAFHGRTLSTLIRTCLGTRLISSLKRMRAGMAGH